jgi:hypothetical protein
MAVVGAAALAAPACHPRAGSEQAAVPGLSPARRELTCASGLRVIAESTPATHFATVTMMVDAGASEDPAGREGLAHLVEHLSFRASEAGQLRRGIDLNAIGVQEDGATDPDAVVFKGDRPDRQPGGDAGSRGGPPREPDHRESKRRPSRSSGTSSATSSGRRRRRT